MPRPSRTAATMLAKLSSARTMSDASRVTSVPLRPMAMPMCASRSAGASLTPSPVIATTAPRAFHVAHDAQLVLGRGARVHALRGVLPRPNDAQLARDRAGGDGLVARDHDGADAGLARGGDGRDRLAARRIGDPDEAQQAQVLLLDAGAHRDAQHAQTARRHVGVRLGGARRARRAQGKQQLGGALDVEDAVRSLDGHPLAVGVERVHVPPRALLLDRPPVDAALGGGRQQRDLRRISRAGASALAQLGVAARGGGRRAARGGSGPTARARSSRPWSASRSCRCR